MKNINVQINFVDGKQGEYECVKRPYFSYDNNTAMLHLTNGIIMVVNILQVVSVMYPDAKSNFGFEVDKPNQTIKWPL